MSDSTGAGFGPLTNWTPLFDNSGESQSSAFAGHETVIEIREHFTKQGPRFRYEGLAGRGAGGFVFRLVENGGLGYRSRVRRLALKRASSPLNEDLMRTEIQWLKVSGVSLLPPARYYPQRPMLQHDEGARKTLTTPPPGERN